MPSPYSRIRIGYFFFLKGTFRKENVHFGFFSHRNLQTEQYTVGDDDAVSTVTETLFQF